MLSTKPLTTTRQWRPYLKTHTRTTTARRRSYRKKKKILPEETTASLRLQISDYCLGKMTTSRRLADRKVERFEKNVTRRGAVPETTTKKGSAYPVGPMVLGLFVFVVIGSSLVQIIRTATSGGLA